MPVVRQRPVFLPGAPGIFSDCQTGAYYYLRPMWTETLKYKESFGIVIIGYLQFAETGKPPASGRAPGHNKELSKNLSVFPAVPNESRKENET